MAHFEANIGWAAEENMVLAHSPINKIHIGGVSGLDHSLLQNQLTNYLLACRVEEKSPLTIQSYAMRIGHFIKFIQGEKLADDVRELTNNHIRLFLSSLQGRCQPSTINGYYRVLRAFFNWLVAEDVLKRSPLNNIKPPRIPKSKPQPFSKQDIENLLILCSGDKFLDVRNRAIILLFLDTGLRLSELANIQLKDVDFDRETIRVMGKGAKERVVRMGKTVQKALLRYLLTRDDHYDCLWVTEERRPLQRNGVQIAIKRLCKRAEITDATPGPHTFRHTAAISYLRNGGGEFTLQNMLGHSTLQMTRRYVSSLGAEDMIVVHKKASPVDNLLK